ncbi:MaoC family dehydratase N-terminal domain-containing protein [Acinetobacter sp. MB5]|uniref:FAS1-like dehydratase domain-containing protein n=1 Tax=Acinetobacter sp. MB5 TaxID=2069438 RepID=UPI000DCFED60|nr:MaoC family dehydratase N-terminal domain-containing protein [Acinetobacter sp. MB5]
MNTLNVMDWLGRKEIFEDTLRLQPAHFMQATLDQDPSLEAGDKLPALWHWIYFLEAKPASQLGRDGHPKKGGFLPPVSLPRRMWAGGRFSFFAPIPLGSEVRKVSSIKDISYKHGRTGELCFVTVLHEFYVNDVLALTEEQDIVYREDPQPNVKQPEPLLAPENAEFSETISPNQVLLYRYSALTFNGHRIHYDVDYARDVEGYEGLVFHGPLTATLLVDLATRMFGRQPIEFSFKGLAPITANHDFKIEGIREGNVMHLWARRHDGALAMKAKAIFS